MVGSPYWTDLNPATITAATGLVVGIGGLTTQYLIARLAHRQKSAQDDQSKEETTEQRLERVANEQFKRVEDERDYFARRLREEEEGRARDETERDLIRQAARAMEDWAHYFRHYGLNIAQRFRSLFVLFEQHVDGTLATERAAAILTEIRPTLPVPPVQVPLLRNAASTTPPRESDLEHGGVV